MKSTIELLAIAALASLVSLTACKKRDSLAGSSPVAEWTSDQAAAPDSLEGQLRAQQKHWVQTDGKITAGAYVQDALEGRQHQPIGRGAIGKVISVSVGDNGAEAATVDFGRGYRVGIYVSELTLVEVAAAEK